MCECVRTIGLESWPMCECVRTMGLECVNVCGLVVTCSEGGNGQCVSVSVQWGWSVCMYVVWCGAHACVYVSCAYLQSTAIIILRREEYVGKTVMVMEVPPCRGKEGEEDQRGGGWITSRTTCPRGNCQGNKRNTELNGGAS